MLNMFEIKLINSVSGNCLFTAPLQYTPHYYKAVCSTSTFIYVSEFESAHVHVHTLAGEEIVPPLNITGLKANEIVHGLTCVGESTLLLSICLNDRPTFVSHIQECQVSVQIIMIGRL